MKTFFALSHKDLYGPAWDEPCPVPWQHLSCPGLILGTLGWDTGTAQHPGEMKVWLSF